MGLYMGIDKKAELENVDKAVDEMEVTGTTSRRCLRCGKKLICETNGNSYLVKCETPNCLYMTFRGI